MVSWSSPGNPQATITCQSRMGRQIRGDVDGQAGIERVEATRQGTMA
jgi:hypothetical protein